MAYDRKYGKVTTEFGSIGDDEPVVVFRGRDFALLKVLAYYHMTCAKLGSPRFHLDTIMDTYEAISDWQQVHSHDTKVPTSDNFKKRMIK